MLFATDQVDQQTEPDLAILVRVQDLRYSLREAGCAERVAAGIDHYSHLFKVLDARKYGIFVFPLYFQGRQPEQYSIGRRVTVGTIDNGVAEKDLV